MAIKAQEKVKIIDIVVMIQEIKNHIKLIDIKLVKKLNQIQDHGEKHKIDQEVVEIDSIDFKLNVLNAINLVIFQKNAKPKNQSRKIKKQSSLLRRKNRMIMYC